LPEATQVPAFAFEQLAPQAAAAPAGPGALRARAEAIVDAAEAQAEAIRDEARRSGYEDGFAAGRAQALEGIDSAASALAQALAAVEASAAELADRIEGEACRFALAAAERIVAGTLDAQPERVLDVVRGALRTLLERERITILLNRDDLDLVRAGFAELAALGGIDHIDVQEERRVARGGAVVRTAVGDVDARIEAKLDRLRATFASEFAG
jgi:flagellar assembly protein FliH